MKRRVVNLFIILSMLFGLFQTTIANYPISVGPFLGLKGGVNAADVLWQNYNGFAFSNLPEMGISSYFPFVQNASFGGGLNLTYSTDGFLMSYKDGVHPEKKITHQYNFFSISPYLYASGFILGLNIALPIGGTQEINSETTDVSSDLLATMFEIKLGGVITVYANEYGRFNIMIEGSYALSGMLKDDYKGNDGSYYNYHPGQMWFGINYMFNLQKPLETE
jgi:hypothetical protein